MDRSESVAKDLPGFLSLLEEMNSKVSTVNQHLTALKRHVESTDFNTEKGVSLLEVKYHLLLSYLTNLTEAMLLKSEGESINGCPAVHRLVEIRTVLEKIRPLDQRLRYQIDKLIRTAATGLTVAANDPLHFRPNPDNLISKLDSEEGSSEDGGGSGEEGSPETRAYVPPRVVAMPYDEDDKIDKKRRRDERLRKKLLRSSLIRDLRDEYLDAPEEVSGVGSGLRRHKVSQEEKEIERFEEDNFLRLPRKRQRGDSGRATTEVVAELTDFSSLSGLTAKELEQDDAPTHKKRKHTVGKSRKQKWKKGSRKIRKH